MTTTAKTVSLSESLWDPGACRPEHDFSADPMARHLLRLPPVISTLLVRLLEASRRGLAGVDFTNISIVDEDAD